jgi:hypothetical protein
MKKTQDKRQARKLILSRENVQSLGQELRDDQLANAQGGTCYTDLRNSQCCPAA